MKSIQTWMQERNISIEQLISESSLDSKIVEAIVAGRYTPSPQQRQRIADALDVEVSEIAWGHKTAVEPMYGHGPQFGRSP